MKIRVEVVLAHARSTDVCALTLPAGATALEAVSASGVLARHPEAAGGKLGVYGKVVPGSRRLLDGDRVEVYRPLAADPKEARRRRAKRAR
ncbi:MAG: RnfH family protein [Betaproteobacteria bacterium]